MPTTDQTHGARCWWCHAQFHAADDAAAQALLEAHIRNGCTKMGAHMATAGPHKTTSISYGLQETVTGGPITVWTVRCSVCQAALASGTKGADDPTAHSVQEAVAAHTCPAGTVFEGRITED